MTRAARFTQADLTRVLRGVEKAGVEATVEICPDGTIRVLTGGKHVANDSYNPLDRMLHG